MIAENWQSILLLMCVVSYVLSPGDVLTGLPVYTGRLLTGKLWSYGYFTNFEFKMKLLLFSAKRFGGESGDDGAFASSFKGAIIALGKHVQVVHCVFVSSPLRI